MVKIKIIRHSERLDYSHPFYWLFCIGHYWNDTPLTTSGHELAAVRGKQLATDDFNPKNIYTSPYIRTMETAIEFKTYFPHSEIVIEPLLSEHQPKYKHTINLYPNGIPTIYDGIQTEFSYPESYEQFTVRVKFIFSKLMEKNKEDFIIVTHGEVLKTYINYLQDEFPDQFLDANTTPYLTTLSLEYDPIDLKIDPQSIKILTN